MQPDSKNAHAAHVTKKREIDSEEVHNFSVPAFLATETKSRQNIQGKNTMNSGKKPCYNPGWLIIGVVISWLQTIPI